MGRAPFQVLVFPYRLVPDRAILYAVFQRGPATGGYWQGLAGGGEAGETPLAAARREACEEAGIAPSNAYLALDSCATIPVVNIAGFLWGAETLVIPEYCFGVQVTDDRCCLSAEHTRFAWLPYREARGRLRWDSNKNALWELDHRLRGR